MSFYCLTEHRASTKHFQRSSTFATIASLFIIALISIPLDNILNEVYGILEAIHSVSHWSETSTLRNSICSDYTWFIVHNDHYLQLEELVSVSLRIFGNFRFKLVSLLYAILLNFLWGNENETLANLLIDQQIEGSLYYCRLDYIKSFYKSVSDMHKNKISNYRHNSY